MNYGLYLAASGVRTQIARQDVISNNLANVNTVGYKPDVFMVRQRDAVRIEDNLPFVDSQRMLEKLGGGVMPLPTRVQFSPGPLQETGTPLDVAIEGDGFLMVQTGDGARLTRDGRMTAGADGRLRTIATGALVLDSNGRTITVDMGQPVQIDRSGAVSQGGREVARLGFTGVADLRALRKVGDNMLAPADGSAIARRPATGSVVQGMIEGSGVDAVRAMIDVTSASNAAQSGLSTISTINEMMTRAIGLGRISG